MGYPIFVIRQEGSHKHGWQPDLPGEHVEGNSDSALAKAANDRVNALLSNVRASSISLNGHGRIAGVVRRRQRRNLEVHRSCLVDVVFGAVLAIPP